MSTWGEIDATFKGLDDFDHNELGHEINERDPRAPTGSESGPVVSNVQGYTYVSGRLRDVRDDEDSPLVLAWFVRYARLADSASMTWEIDDGPRYRYVYTDGELRKLKGVLDQ